jgi:hypothetical protein
MGIYQPDKAIFRSILPGHRLDAVSAALALSPAGDRSRRAFRTGAVPGGYPTFPLGQVR